jgi:hypothetical protein
LSVLTFICPTRSKRSICAGGNSCQFKLHPGHLSSIAALLTFAANHANAGEFYIADEIAKAIRATVEERPMPDPRITDHDAGEITASVDGKEIRGWSYKDATEQSIKMRMAHEFAEGWFQASHMVIAP